MVMSGILDDFGSFLSDRMVVLGWTSDSLSRHISLLYDQVGMHLLDVRSACTCASAGVIFRGILH